jgi:DNA replication and repair protein RecF
VTPEVLDVDADAPAATPRAAARLRAISIHDFRNLARVVLDIPPPGLVVMGDNGQGKTNFLEAIYYCHLFRSMRGGRDADLVRFGAAAFHIAATADGAPFGEVAAGYERGTRRKKVVLDGVECTRLSDALGALPNVIFSPRDVEIVSGGPALRRRYVDVALASISRRYLASLQQYRAALVRRNAALRAARSSSAATAIHVWEVPLARHGAVLCEERQAWIEWSRERFAGLCAAIGERDVADLRYRPSVDLSGARDAGAMERALLAALAQHRDRDIQRGLTHTGPHRDDLDLRLGAHGMRTFGSAGQQRTAAIALRLLECRTYRERSGREPLILLDDPFAELDPARAARILGLITSGRDGQAIFTVPRPGDIPEALRGLSRVRVRDGQVAA